MVVAVASCAQRVDSGPPVAEVPADPWVAVGKEADAGSALFAPCAACHMADGSGRDDGAVPRLAGQSAAILVEKLQRLQRGETHLPVMVPYARALSSAETEAVARYLAGLPVARPAIRERDGEQAYVSLCAGCHGSAGEGNDGLRAPRLCSQHAAYLLRRMDEIAVNGRGDSEPAMIAIVASLGAEQRAAIASWLAAADCSADGGS